MGTRTLFQVHDADSQLLATLYSNSCHPLHDPQDMFLACCECTPLGPTTLLQHLLSCRYGSDAGTHRKGDRVFWLVPASEVLDGDYELLVTARSVVSFDAESRAKSSTKDAWSVVAVYRQDATA